MGRASRGFSQYFAGSRHLGLTVRALIAATVPCLIRSAEIDLSFHAIVGRDQWRGIQLIPYVHDPLVAICSGDHPLASRSSVSLETLSKEIFVDLTPDRALRRLVE
jgi:DNA-binding transcriptional LysR family regulator